MAAGLVWFSEAELREIEQALLWLDHERDWAATDEQHALTMAALDKVRRALP